jgi:hypothetical protein
MRDYILQKDLPSSYETNSESIISKPRNDESISTINFFEFDIVTDTLKHIHSGSKLRKFLSSSLAKFYSYPVLIIIFSFLTGLLFLGVPMIVIYLKIFNNFMKPIIFLILISLFFSILIIVVHVIDDKRNKVSILAKWERKMILKNLGLSLTLTILVIWAFLMHNFFDNIMEYHKKNEIDLNYDENNDKVVEIHDIIIKYIINCFLFNQTKIYNEKLEVKYSINEPASFLTDLHFSLLIAIIPFFIFAMNKFIKVIIIEVKYAVAQLITFINSFLLCILIYFTYFFYDDKDASWTIISALEIILLGFIYFGYIFWNIHFICKFCKNPKDKSFSINRYDLSHIIMITFFDIINIIGSTLLYFSIMANYINSANKNETLNDLKIVLILLKIGFLLTTISNSYYYGHHLLSLIFRPIAIQYTPAKLKKYYIRANKNLSSFIIPS